MLNETKRSKGLTIALRHTIPTISATYFIAVRLFLGIVLSTFRDPSKSELELVEPSKEVIKEFESLNLGANAGVFVLLPFVDCAAGVDSDAWCRKYSMPGNGSRFSFRERKYRYDRLADISLESGGILKAGSVKTLGILVGLGKVPLESVTLQTPGLEDLWSFTAPRGKAAVETTWERVDKGYSIGQLRFASRVTATPGHTYLLRSIAYRGTSNREAWGYVFNELGYDKRGDYLLAFSIRDVSAEGTMTVIWRLLQNKPAPKE